MTMVETMLLQIASDERDERRRRLMRYASFCQRQAVAESRNGDKERSRYWWGRLAWAIAVRHRYDGRWVLQRAARATARMQEGRAA